MSSLTITITNAGRVALVNAQNTGSNALLISQVGLSPTHQAGSLTALGALAGETKRLASIAGAVVADDTIHLTVRDETADVYDMRSFALYLSDGTLFAAYSQPTPIVQKSAAALMLLAVDVIITALGDADITFGSADFINPPATEGTPGVAEIATAAEVSAGTDNTRIVSPKGLAGRLAAFWTTIVEYGAANWVSPVATTVIKGLVELATNTEAVAGTDATRAVTPSGLKAAIAAIPAASYATYTEPGLIEIASSLQVINEVGETAAVTPVTFHAALRAFARLIATNGYLQIPGTPIILQWGRLTGSFAEGSRTVTFPTSFPTGCLLLKGQVNNPSAATGLEAFAQGLGSAGQSSGQLMINMVGSSTPVTRLDWFAIGY